MEARMKAFDCVDMKHRGAEKVQEAIRGMTMEEELAFWVEGTRDLLARKEALQAAGRAPVPENEVSPPGR